MSLTFATLCPTRFTYSCVAWSSYRPSALTISWWFFWVCFFSPSMVPVTTVLPPVAGLEAQPATKTAEAARQRTSSGRRFIGSGLRKRAERLFNYDMAPRQQVPGGPPGLLPGQQKGAHFTRKRSCLLYTSDAADERSSVDLG